MVKLSISSSDGCPQTQLSYHMMPPAPFNEHKNWKICYVRDFMRSLADSPYALLPPSNIREMVFEMGEILAKFPQRYQAPGSCFQGWMTRVPTTEAITYGIKQQQGSYGQKRSSFGQLSAAGDARPSSSGKSN